MEDKKDGSNASTSKIEERSYNSEQDMEEEEQDERSNSNISKSSVYSGLSEMEVAGLGAGIPKVPRIMQKILDGKGRSGQPSFLNPSRAKALGRVQKRRLRTNARRRAPRRAQKNTPTSRKSKRYRNYLTATPYRQTSKVQNYVCQYCGHRCCRRFRDQRRRPEKRKRRRRNFKRVNERRRGKKNILVTVSASIQAGSRSKMLSPLFLQTNNILTDSPNTEEHNCEITLTMITEVIKKLSMWTQAVKTSAILKHLKMTYPIKCGDDYLRKILLEKLKAATVAGVVTQVSTDCWELSRDLPKRKSTKTHVTQLWEMHRDTMSPITRADEKAHTEREDASTAMKKNEVI